VTSSLSLEAASTAMLVIELQNDLAHPSVASKRGLPGALARAVAERGLLPRLAALLEICRRAGVTVLYATKERHPSIPQPPVARIHSAGGSTPILVTGTWGAQVVDDVKPQPEDIVLPRYVSIDPSHGSTLWAVLTNLGVTTLVCAGISTTLAVEGTVRGAVNRGIRCVVVEDCCASVPHEWHEFSARNVLPLLADVVPASEVASALS
jgi:nicotinamidase-related amidase